MGFFSKKSKKTETDVYGGDYGMQDDENLPVAEIVCEVRSSDEQPSLTTYKTTADNLPIIDPSASGSASGQKIPAIWLSRMPMPMECCPCCQVAGARTRVVTYPSRITWALCVLIVFIFWPLCWIPLVMEKVRFLSAVIMYRKSTGSFLHSTDFQVTHTPGRSIV